MHLASNNVLGYILLYRFLRKPVFSGSAALKCLLTVVRTCKVDIDTAGSVPDGTAI